MNSVRPARWDRETETRTPFETLDDLVAVPFIAEARAAGMALLQAEHRWPSDVVPEPWILLAQDASGEVSVLGYLGAHVPDLPELRLRGVVKRTQEATRG